jgi:cell wall-associated NlpC family hydrolase
MRQLFIQWLFSTLGTPYIWAGQDRAGTDCSGLIVLAGREFNLFTQDLTAEMMFNHFDEVTNPKAGDLVFYKNGQDRIIHVEVLIGQGRTIGASGGGRRCTTPTPGACVKIAKLKRGRSIAGYRSIPNIDSETLTTGSVK